MCVVSAKGLHLTGCPDEHGWGVVSPAKDTEVSLVANLRTFCRNFTRLHCQVIDLIDCQGGQMKFETRHSSHTFSPNNQPSTHHP